MRFATLFVCPLATAALVVAFGWPVLLACFVLALGTLLFSTADGDAEADAEAEELGPAEGFLGLNRRSSVEGSIDDVRLKLMGSARQR